MIPATQEEQHQLLDLQRLDTAIRQLEHRRSHLPEQKALDENAETLQVLASDYATNKGELEAAERSQKRLEEDINTVEARRKSEEGRMYSGLITSQKELEALRDEINALKARKSDVEEELLDVMERAEDLSGMVDSLRSRHEELTHAVDELTRARDDAAKEIDAELAERRGEREDIVATIDAELLTTYESVRDRKGGVAIASLDGRTCAGCRIELTAIELEEVRHGAMRGMAKCAQCDRLLVVS